MIKAVFSISFLLSSVTWSSEIILIYLYDAQETFLIIINVENSYDAAYIFKKYIYKKKLDAFYLSGFFEIRFSPFVIILEIVTEMSLLSLLINLICSYE